MIALSQLRDAWEAFFFKPQPPTAIALYRILYGLLALAYGALLAPDLFVWLGEHGVLSAAAAHAELGTPRLNVLDALPAGDGWLVGVFATTMVAAATLTVGLFTRTSAIVLFIGLVSLHHRDPLITNSGEALIRSAGFFLIFSQAGAALSLDRWLRLRRGEVSGPPAPCAPWAQRLIQLQLAAVYLTTFAHKADGPSWLDGTALYVTSRLDDFWRLPVPYLFDHLWTLQLATWGTLAFEAAFPFLVWIQAACYPVLAAGVLLHGGIEWSMNIPLFSARMLAIYVLFVPPQDLERLVRWGLSRRALVGNRSA